MPGLSPDCAAPEPGAEGAEPWLKVTPLREAELRAERGGQTRPRPVRRPVPPQSRRVCPSRSPPARKPSGSSAAPQALRFWAPLGLSLGGARFRGLWRGPRRCAWGTEEVCVGEGRRLGPSSGPSSGLRAAVVTAATPSAGAAADLSAGSRHGVPLRGTNRAGTPGSPGTLEGERGPGQKTPGLLGQRPEGSTDSEPLCVRGLGSPNPAAWPSPRLRTGCPGPYPRESGGTFPPSQLPRPPRK